MILSSTIRRSITSLPCTSLKKAFVASSILLASVTQAKPDICFTAMSSVPERMLLKPEMKEANMSGATLIPLNISGEKGAVSVVEEQGKPASEILSQTSGEYGSIAFVVRRPG
jgi:hypothetical protein